MEEQDETKLPTKQELQGLRQRLEASLKNKRRSSLALLLSGELDEQQRILKRNPGLTQEELQDWMDSHGF